MPGPEAGHEVRRVLIVTYEYPPLGGGGGVIFRDLAEELARRMEITVLTSDGPGLAPHERSGGLEIVRTPVLMRNAKAVASLPSMLSFFPSSMRTGRRLLESRGYDLVHSSFAVPSGPSGLLLARRFRLPHVLSVHGGDIYDPSKRLSPHHTPLLKQTVRRVIQGSDRVVAQSTDTARRTTEIYGDRHVDIVPLALKPIPFESVSRAQLNLDLEPGHIVLITVGRLVPRKGLEQLVDVVSSANEPRLRLLIVGEGPLRDPLEARARAARALDRVRFTGFVSDERKWQLLSASDVYVSTTMHEGFGIVFLEAMESGLPVVTYDRGGQTDFLRPEFAELIPYGRLGEFRDRLLRLARDGAARARMGEVARREAKGYYLDRFTDRYAEIYRECLAGASGR
jgi:glycosyltransferase involved in cell wall biosynthesis